MCLVKKHWSMKDLYVLFVMIRDILQIFTQTAAIRCQGFGEASITTIAAAETIY